MGGGWDDERGRRRGGVCKQRGADVGWSVSK